MELLAVITRFYACVRSAIYRIGFLSQIEANKVPGKKVDAWNRFLSFSLTFFFGSYTKSLLPYRECYKNKTTIFSWNQQNIYKLNYHITLAQTWEKYIHKLNCKTPFNFFLTINWEKQQFLSCNTEWSKRKQITVDAAIFG